MILTLDDLPKDASNTRNGKLFLIAYHVYTNQGISHEKLFRYGKRWGNINERVEEYIAEIVWRGLISNHGMKYYVENGNLREWGESHGFIEVPEPVKCGECGFEYLTSISKCPECGSYNRESVSTDSVSTTYTQPTPEIIQNQKNIGEHVNRPTYTNIQKKENSRQKTGKQGELKAIEILNQYGDARKGKGTYGEPDVYWISSNHSYGIEVKSVGHNKRNKSFKLDRKAWDRLCGYCDHNELIPAIFVEERINGSPMGDNYHLILRHRVDEKLADSDADRVSISIYELSTLHHQAFSLGRKTELREGI